MHEPDLRRNTVRLALGAMLCVIAASDVSGQESPRRSDSDSAVSLRAVDVTAAPLKTGEVRRRNSQGRFLTRDQLARQEKRRFGDVVKSLAGVKVVTDHGAMYAVSNRGRNTIYGANGPCLMQVYLDGASVYSGSDDATDHLQVKYDLNQIQTGDVERVELYASAPEIPAEYNRTGSTCGVLMIWTRQR